MKLSMLFLLLFMLCISGCRLYDDSIKDTYVFEEYQKVRMEVELLERLRRFKGYE